VKHWRYAYELARGLMPRVLYRPMATKLRALQNLGGLAQDCTDLLRTTARIASSVRGLATACAIVQPELEARERATCAQFVSRVARARCPGRITGRQRAGPPQLIRAQQRHRAAWGSAGVARWTFGTAPDPVEHLLRFVEEDLVVGDDAELEIAPFLCPFAPSPAPVQFALPRYRNLPSTATSLRCTRGHVRSWKDAPVRSAGCRASSARNGWEGADACRIRMATPDAASSSKTPITER